MQSVDSVFRVIIHLLSYSWELIVGREAADEARSKRCEHRQMSDDHNKFSPLHDVQLQPLRHFGDSSSSTTTNNNGNGNGGLSSSGSSDLHAIHITSISPRGGIGGGGNVNGMMDSSSMADDNDDGSNGMGGMINKRNRRSSHDGIDNPSTPKEWPSVLKDGNLQSYLINEWWSSKCTGYDDIVG
jgi:hypothetical protein